MASIAALVASRSGVGPIVGKGVGVGSTFPEGEICPPNPALAELIGMANPMPAMGLPESSVSTLDTTTPATSPYIFKSGPPLFPGFKDASVCKRPSRLAEMIPTLTVGSNPSDRPRGKPMAITSSPTRISSESPMAMGVKDSVASISMYAR